MKGRGGKMGGSGGWLVTQKEFGLKWVVLVWFETRWVRLGWAAKKFLSSLLIVLKVNNIKLSHFAH